MKIFIIVNSIHFLTEKAVWMLRVPCCLARMLYFFENWWWLCKALRNKDSIAVIYRKDGRIKHIITAP